MKEDFWEKQRRKEKSRKINNVKDTYSTYTQNPSSSKIPSLMKSELKHLLPLMLSNKKVHKNSGLESPTSKELMPDVILGTKE